MTGGPLYYDDSAKAEARERFKKSIEDFFGFGPEHLTLQYNTWNLSTWQEEDLKEITENPKQTLNVLDKLWKELANTDRPKTTVEPIQSEIKLGIPKQLPIAYSKIQNIITTSGLVEIAGRGTNEATGASGTTHGAVGSGTTAEALADKTLETEEDRKAFDTDGTRAISGTTERYGLAFSRSDFGADKTITEAGLLTAATNGQLIARVVASGVTVTTGRIMTMQVDITHVNGTQV